ncbi:phage gene 29 protein family protein [Nocardia jiangxiensis]|uniref:phage gene 29 protein family protein n=1 Tax=Nocardia jiangxiensis TaxID=282685 RepID=UPI0003138880|nr:DUF2744 domain-containing protein [Nocardia jiangxiensis]
MASTNKRFPQYDECDPKDPTEHFLWALTQIQMGDTETMPIQLNTAKVISKHLFELGFRHHSKLQTKKLRLPPRGNPSFLNGLARWVPMDAEEVEPLVLPNVRGMTTQEREWIHQELRNVGHITDPPPDRGPVAAATTWDELQVKIQRGTTAEEVLGGDA